MADPSWKYPNQRPAHDPWIDALVQSAVKFWHDRNVNVSNSYTDVASNLGSGVNGRGYFNEGRIVLNGKETGARLAVARNKKYSVAGRRRNLQELARTIFHEVGHDQLPDHTEQGLMNAWGGDDPPWDAQRLSRKLIPKKKKKK
jgi:hypothetical protein